ncbi:hypothetical protein J2Z32_002366 [Paenibacillus turicensis]|uniref:Uncharacterized protein n=1 Tax=Paenibacillus turicensis TaxID=160487 RepID=A0ABS4FT09_9BACL|nr:hypothetical protein [Paenibacillus turicensis]
MKDIKWEVIDLSILRKGEEDIYSFEIIVVNGLIKFSFMNEGCSVKPLEGEIYL